MCTIGRSAGKAPVQTKTSQAHPGPAGKAEQKQPPLPLCVRFTSVTLE